MRTTTWIRPLDRVSLAEIEGPADLAGLLGEVLAAGGTRLDDPLLLPLRFLEDLAGASPAVLGERLDKAGRALASAPGSADWRFGVPPAVWDHLLRKAGVAPSPGLEVRADGSSSERAEGVLRGRWQEWWQHPSSSVSGAEHALDRVKRLWAWGSVCEPDRPDRVSASDVSPRCLWRVEKDRSFRPSFGVDALFDELAQRSAARTSGGSALADDDREAQLRDHAQAQRLPVGAGPGALVQALLGVVAEVDRRGPRSRARGGPAAPVQELRNRDRAALWLCLVLPALAPSVRAPAPRSFTLPPDALGELVGKGYLCRAVLRVADVEQAGGAIREVVVAAGGAIERLEGDVVVARVGRAAIDACFAGALSVGEVVTRDRTDDTGQPEARFAVALWPREPKVRDAGAARPSVEPPIAQTIGFYLLHPRARGLVIAADQLYTAWFSRREDDLAAVLEGLGRPTPWIALGVRDLLADLRARVEGPGVDSGFSFGAIEELVAAGLPARDPAVAAHVAQGLGPVEAAAKARAALSEEALAAAEAQAREELEALADAWDAALHQAPPDGDRARRDGRMAERVRRNLSNATYELERRLAATRPQRSLPDVADLVLSRWLDPDRV